ncbi:hypothetical protein MHU86_6209 [Fragilaria crotonensis]|nr:hypothetical protein MHU86_24428 [Fragilaria crotonensis]KAI2508280.1 hypothetical protein MHU86_6209 [Fragilaria crotonensis]
MMRGLLRDMLPKDFGVSSKFINNVKTKVKLKLMNGDFDLLLSEGRVSEGDVEFILSPSDNLPPEYLSVAQDIANETLKEALSDPEVCAWWFNTSVDCIKRIHLFSLTFNVIRMIQWLEFAGKQPQ